MKLKFDKRISNYAFNINLCRYILDDAGRPVDPPGFPGWLHLSGPGLASGYLGDATATADCFKSLGVVGGGMTWYATGDRAMVRRDGRLVMLGRGGGEGKVRGRLVDLSGAEEVLRAHPRVRNCALVARSLRAAEEDDAAADAADGGGGGGGGGGDNAVVAFVVPVDGGGGTTRGALTAAAVGEIRAWLAQRLPPAAVPTRVVGVEVWRYKLNR